ncbi:hypothetical protein AVEN_108933-1 [Araneus ventricosus]|uniref:Uncharacterized protein n=1 Tax=Araneus ventricosus TaxID=182803 RepID=A0A4Y2EP81_ARAVE|nr:hypothetical protein AVEN_108933-1 [Araneus ventricosus]
MVLFRNLEPLGPESSILTTRQEEFPLSEVSCLILSEYQESDNFSSVCSVHMHRLLVRRPCRLCAMNCVIDFELGDLRYRRSCMLPSGEYSRR